MSNTSNKVLFCGMHRSGTSAVSNLCSYAAELRLLDDPQWAIEDTTIVFKSSKFAHLIQGFDAFKIPRMTAFVSEFCKKFRECSVVWIARDPRDVFCSIMEGVEHNPTTNMLSFSEIGLHGKKISNYFSAYHIYLNSIREYMSTPGVSFLIVRYETFYARKTACIQEICWGFLGRSVCRDVKYIENYQFGPIRHKSGGIDGPGRYLKYNLKEHASELENLRNKQEVIIGQFDKYLISG